MAEAQIAKRTLEDREGNPISYEIIPLRPSQNLDLALNILACIARPGARLISLAIEAEGADTEIEEVLASVDLSDIGQDVESTVRSLAAEPTLVRRLFTNCMRDGADMGEDVHFDKAYAGNYGEMYEALKEIVDVNGLLPFLDTLGN